MRKLKKGDDVIVTTGRDKGKRGAILRVLDGDHLIVEGANKVKKHQRPNPMRGITGGIIEKEMPLHVSKGAIFNPQTRKADRVVVYAFHHAAEVWWRGLEGKVSRLANLEVWRIPAAQAQELAGMAQRSMQLQATLQEGALLLGDAAHSLNLEPQAWKALSAA